MKIFVWRFFLSVFLGALICIGIFFFYSGKRNIGNKLPFVPFGVNENFTLFKGRPFDLSKETASLSQNHQKLLKKSRENWNSGNRTEALGQVKEIINENPGSITAIMAQIDFIEGLNDSSKSRVIQNLYRQLLEKDPGHPYVHYRYGLFLSVTGKPEKAILHFQIASDISPMYPNPYLEMAGYYFQISDHNKAIRSAHIAISLFNGSKDAPYDLLAILYYEMGMNDSSAMVIEHIKFKGYHSPLTTVIESILLESASQPEKARHQYHKIFSQDSSKILVKKAFKPDGMNIRHRIVNLSGTSGWEWEEISDAIEILEPLVRGYPGNGSLWMALAKAYLQHSLYAHSLDCADSIEKYAPNIDTKNIRMEANMGLMKQNVIPADGKSLDESGEPKQTSYKKNTSYNETALEIGRFYIPWKLSRSRVKKSIAYLRPISLENGNLMLKFENDGLVFETIFGFSGEELWGIFIMVQQSQNKEKDVFGRMLKNISLISGNGQSTGFAKCRGFRPCQGVVWEKEETVEFLAQFKGRQNQARLIRFDRNRVVRKQKLCDLVGLLNRDIWTNN